MQALDEEVSSKKRSSDQPRNTLSGLVETETHKALLLQMETVRAQWKVLIVQYEQVKKSNKKKELEVQFSTLDGSVLSSIDNLKKRLLIWRKGYLR